MGNGFYGFMEQTQMIFGGMFSYCLQSPFTERYGSPISSMYLQLGNDVLHGPVTGMMSTPIFRNQIRNRKAYFLSLEDISVGSRRLEIHPYVFAIKDGGSGGFVID
ncbi:hypothetical protein RND81_01G101400 [Saponaria officinalis]|uniref:Uncharacterized protein n=1 Tax=Saponaria officinalis TaxID=3572 RepID=A0AAW1N6N3_SAPOF